MNDLLRFPDLRARVTFDPRSVLIVIPALNEADHIVACLESLIAPELEGARIILADGGSEDGTVDLAKAAVGDLEVCWNHDRIQSAGVSRAVEEMALPEHRILVRCDAHMRYPAGFVRDVVTSLEERAAASVVVAMDSAGRSGFGRAAAWVVDTPMGSGGSAHRGGQRSGWVDHGHHAAFDLDWFRKVGGYDRTFTHNEDGEYDLRLRKAGGRLWLDAGPRLTYWMRDSPGALARQYWSYGRGRARTVRKHRVMPRLRQLIPVTHFVVQVAALALALLVGPVFLLFPVIYLALLAGVSGVSVMRLGRNGLWAGIALGIMHLTWGAGFLWQILRGWRHA